MGFMDRLKDTAAKNKGKIGGGLDKAGEFVDKRTKGKYADQIATGKAKAKQRLDDLDDGPGTGGPGGGGVNPPR